MCGIVGYIGDEKDITSLLLEGLKRLEYRGYDSAGLALLDSGKKIQVIKEVGKIRELEMKVGKEKSSSVLLGIGHTRWATHGGVTVPNAHPHMDCKGSIALVHNGIIENYIELKEKLSQAGHKFLSETDTEVLVHLIEEFYKESGDAEEAVCEALHNVEGTFGICVIFRDEPDKIIAARKGSPLIIGVKEKSSIIASDVSAILQHTDKVVYLKDNELAVITRSGFELKDFDRQKLNKNVEKVYWSIDQIDKGKFPHFMLKEIFEQSETILNSFRGRLDKENGTAHFGGLNLTPYELRHVQRILILACGTSWHAALVGKYMIEKLAGIPVSVEYASEYRYRSSVMEINTLVVVISQSGETADTLAALREAKRKGAKVLGITNVIGSTIARETDGGIYLHAGPEIGVASTKAFTSQLVVLLLLALFLGRQRMLSYDDGMGIIKEIETLPEKVKAVISHADEIEKLAELFVNNNNSLYLGRGFNYPVALEGALKLKEISYIHAEGYPAAEMKHGPIALIDEGMPVVVIALKDSIYEKIVSNIEEVKARKAKVIAVASEGDQEITRRAHHVLRIPETMEVTSSILSVIPLQLLAYYIAVKRGCNVDQPKNLAKSVTVE